MEFTVFKNKQKRTSDTGSSGIARVDLPVSSQLKGGQDRIRFYSSTERTFEWVGILTSFP